MRLTLSFLSSQFTTLSKCQDKNLNILRTKWALEVKYNAFFIIFKGLSVAKNCVRPESALFNLSVSIMTSSSSCFLIFAFPVTFYKHCFTSPTILCPAHYGTLLRLNFYFACSVTTNSCILSTSVFFDSGIFLDVLLWSGYRWATTNKLWYLSFLLFYI